MSVHSKIKRITVPELRARKGAEPIVSLTAYHAHTARYVDPYVDFLLVGDSLGMVMYGMETTLGVTLDMMIAHGAAVVRGTERALVVVDMPFGSYEESPEVAFRNAVRVIKETGCTAVKMEGGARLAPTIRYLVDRGIPVMAHIGLTPQSVQVMGGFKAQGRDEHDGDGEAYDPGAVFFPKFGELFAAKVFFDFAKEIGHKATPRRKAEGRRGSARRPPPAGRVK